MRLLLVLLAAMLAACASEAPLTAADPPAPLAPPQAASRDAPRPLLRPVRLRAGQPDTLAVGDLLGAAAGPVAFGASPDVTVWHDLAAGTVTLQTAEGFEGLTTVPLFMDGDTLALPVEVVVPATHTFTFRPTLATPDAPLPEVYVIGAFNDWARGKDRLTDPDGDRVLAVTLPIAPGRYEYKFTVDGAEVTDPARPDSVPNPFGAFNNVLTVRPRRGDRAVLRPVEWAHHRTPRTQFTFALEWTEADGNPLRPDLAPGDVVALLDNERLPAEVIEIADALITVTVPDASGAHTLRLAADLDGLVTPWVEIPLYNGAPRTERADDAPFDWRDAVVYQIMIDRFADGDPSNSTPVPGDSLAPQANYMGGDLQGLLDKLEEGYFDALGVNVLWLSPVYDNPNRAYREYPPPHRFYTGYHGYWPMQPRAVDEHFGDLALLRRVVDAAHARGMKVLLDFVAHHVHEDHPYFRAHPEWFGDLALPDGRLNLRLWDEHRLTTWFEPYLPSFDFTDSPDA
ncbi:MAG TPA: alpha-amylase family glycosyl hydrolase, partial [Rubricoccaceae bacterium]|nr:alpha-amylase family glycosyl hydrolase [Rubricoccaceae bacterium]